MPLDVDRLVERAPVSAVRVSGPFVRTAARSRFWSTEEVMVRSSGPGASPSPLATAFRRSTSCSSTAHHVDFAGQRGRRTHVASLPIGVNHLVDVALDLAPVVGRRTNRARGSWRSRRNGPVPLARNRRRSRCPCDDRPGRLPGFVSTTCSSCERRWIASEGWGTAPWFRSQPLVKSSCRTSDVAV